MAHITKPGQNAVTTLPPGGVIPNVVITTPQDPSGQIPPSQSTAAARESTRQQIMTASRDTVIPIVYGGFERMAGKVYLVRVYNQKLVLALILAEASPNGIESIDNVELNDVALTGGSWSGDSRTYSNGVIVKRYLGAQVSADPTLAAAISGFAEVLAGTAYIVVQVPKGVSPGFPRITAEVKGRKVYDPRDGTQSLGDASTWKWSDNPALCLADFLASTTYGARKSVDWSNVTTAANYCDETVGTSPNTEKRALLTLSLAEKRSVKDWVDVLRSYVPAWIDYAGEVAIVVPDKARASDHTFTAENIDSEPAPRIRKRGVRDTPNVVEVGYMRTDVKPWAMAYASADTSPAVRRKARIDMPGIRRYSHARRVAIERLNHYTLEDLEGQVAVFEDGLKVTVGDVATITDDIGLSAKEMRILAKEDRGHGRWVLAFREYDPAAYSSSVETTPTTPDTGLPDPKSVAAPTGLTITETVYLEKALTADSLARGLIYQSRFDVNWTATTHVYPVIYRVQFWDGATLIHEGQTPGVSYASPAVQQGKTYTVRIYARNSLGFESAVLEGSQTAQGKLLAPGDVPAITMAFEIGGEVLLEWDPAIDIDIVRYEWRYTPGVTGGGSWTSATLIDRVDGLRARFLGLLTGTHRFYVKAIDSVGNYSANAATVDITVTTDANSFIQTVTFTTPTLSNMVAARKPDDPLTTWISQYSGTWNSAFSTAIAGFTNALVTYFGSGTSYLQTESFDFGTELSGDLAATWDATDVSGSGQPVIEHSLDGSAWTTVNGITAKATFRFVRLKRTTTGFQKIHGMPTLTLNVLSREEGQLVTTSSSIYKTVLLRGHYFAAISISVTPQGDGSATRTGIYDAVALYPMEGEAIYHEANFTSATSPFAIWITGNPSRVIASGDYLWWEVYAVDKNDGGCYLHFTDTSDSSAANDSDGINCLNGPGTGYIGQWKTRKVDLTAFVGKTTDFLATIVNEASTGKHRALIRNVRIADSGGTLRLAIWTAGEVFSHGLAASNNANNTVCNRMNSFDVYVLNGSNAKQAVPAFANFKGI